MTDSISFHLTGIPIPQGSMNAYVRGGRAVLVHTKDRELRQWRNKLCHAIHTTAREAGWETPLDEPVEVWAIYELPRPKSATKREFPHVKPDLDKLNRALGDALGEALLKDDSRIIGWYSRKHYETTDGAPCVHVRVTRNPKLKPSHEIWTDQTVIF